jgi:2'-hydroxyisoflavone reductase
VPAGVNFIQANREEDDGLRAVANDSWDAVIDVSRQPGQVKRAVRDLQQSAQTYVFVSSANVYADQRRIGQDEDAPLLAPLESDVMETMATYGEAKVACEQAVVDAFGQDRSLIVRVGLIGGPGDIFGRTGYWPLRFAHPSTGDNSVLVPLAPDLPTSIIDVRDLAAWLATAAKTRIHGVFNGTGDVYPFDEHLAVARRVAGHTGPLAVATPDWLHQHDVGEWAGERSLPLWLSDPDWRGMSARSNARAKAAGLTLRPLAETLVDSLVWEVSRGIDVPRRAGLTSAEEARLLAELKRTPRF